MLLALLAAPASATNQNEMTEVARYEGEDYYHSFGSATTMGDFDGLDEFIIAASYWTTVPDYALDRNYYYDFRFFWLTAPTWTLSGDDLNQRYDIVNENVGDINGDGIEDFALVDLTLNGDGCRLNVLFGGVNFDSLPDWSMENIFAFLGGMAHGCGDVNGDGYNDFSFTVYPNTVEGRPIFFGVRMWTPRPMP